MSHTQQQHWPSPNCRLCTLNSTYMQSIPTNTTFHRVNDIHFFSCTSQFSVLLCACKWLRVYVHFFCSPDHLVRSVDTKKKTFIAICIIIIAIEQQTRNWKMLRGSNNIDLFSINLFSPFTEDHLYVLGAVLAMRNELREREIEIEREREKNWIY